MLQNWNLKWIYGVGSIEGLCQMTQANIVQIQKQNFLLNCWDTVEKYHAYFLLLTFNYAHTETTVEVVERTF